MYLSIFGESLLNYIIFIYCILYIVLFYPLLKSVGSRSFSMVNTAITIQLAIIVVKFIAIPMFCFLKIVINYNIYKYI